MTLLETRQPDFPQHPGDGFQIKEDLEDGYIMWTYSEQFNQWTYEVFKNALQGFIYTDQVRTRGEDVPATKDAGDEPQLLTQKDVNHYLATKDELAALQAQVDNLSGLLIQARYEQGVGIAPRPGEFLCLEEMTQKDRFSQASELRLFESDLDNKYPALLRVISGDIIHIVESTTGNFCQLRVTQATGIAMKYEYVVGTLDRISDRVPYEFRISGAAAANG
jgi:hypothetical protein